MRTSLGSVDLEYDFGPARLNSITSVQRTKLTLRYDLTAVYAPLITQFFGFTPDTRGRGRRSRRAQDDAGVPPDVGRRRRGRMAGRPVLRPRDGRPEAARVRHRGGGTAAMPDLAPLDLAQQVPGARGLRRRHLERDVAAWRSPAACAWRRTSRTSRRTAAARWRRLAAAGALEGDAQDLARDRALRAHAHQQRLRARRQRLPPGRPERGAARPGDRPADRRPRPSSTTRCGATRRATRATCWTTRCPSRPPSTTSAGTTSSRSTRSTAIGVIVNAGKAEIQGFELGATWRPSARWSVVGHLSTIDGRLKEDAPGLGAAGPRLPNSADAVGLARREGVVRPRRPRGLVRRVRALRRRAQRGLRRQRHRAQLPHAGLLAHRPAGRRRLRPASRCRCTCATCSTRTRSWARRPRRWRSAAPRRSSWRARARWA